MSKEIEIGGCIEVPDEITSDEVMDAFIYFIESKGWYFGGGCHELTEKHLKEDKVRVIKISKEALFEFIYEKFLDNQEEFFDVNTYDVTSSFDINFEQGEFIFCVSKAEDDNGKILKLPEEIDLQHLMKSMPDTTATMFQQDRYKEFTKEELVELSKENVIR